MNDPLRFVVTLIAWWAGLASALTVTWMVGMGVLRRRRDRADTAVNRP